MAVVEYDMARNKCARPNRTRPRPQVSLSSANALTPAQQVLHLVASAYSPQLTQTTQPLSQPGFAPSGVPAYAPAAGGGGTGQHGVHGNGVVHAGAPPVPIQTISLIEHTRLIQAMDADLAKERAERIRFESELRDAKAAKEAVMAERRQLQASLTATAGQVTQLSAELSAMQTEWVRERHTVSELQDQMRASQSDLHRADMHIAALQEEKDALVNRLRASADGTDQTTADLTSRITQLNGDIRTAQTKLITAETEVARLRVAIDDAKFAHDRLSVEVKAKDDALKTAIKAAEDLRRAQHQAEVNADALKAAHERLKLEFAEKTRQHDDTMRHLRKQLVDTDQANTDNVAMMKAALLRTEAEVRDLQAKATASDMARARELNEAATALAERDQARAALESLRAHNQITLAENERRVRALQSEILVLQGVQTDLEATARSNQGVTDALDRKIAGYQQEVSGLQESIEVLRRREAQLKEDANQHAHDIADRDRTLSAMASRLSAVELELAAALAKEAELGAKLTEMHMQSTPSPRTQDPGEPQAGSPEWFEQWYANTIPERPPMDNTVEGGIQQLLYATAFMVSLNTAIVQNRGRLRVDTPHSLIEFLTRIKASISVPYMFFTKTEGSTYAPLQTPVYRRAADLYLDNPHAVFASYPEVILRTRQLMRRDVYARADAVWSQKAEIGMYRPSHFYNELREAYQNALHVTNELEPDIGTMQWQAPDDRGIPTDVVYDQASGRRMLFSWERDADATNNTPVTTFSDELTFSPASVAYLHAGNDSTFPNLRSWPDFVTDVYRTQAQGTGRGSWLLRDKSVFSGYNRIYHTLVTQEVPESNNLFAWPVDVEVTAALTQYYQELTAILANVGDALGGYESSQEIQSLAMALYPDRDVSELVKWMPAHIAVRGGEGLVHSDLRQRFESMLLALAPFYTTGAASLMMMVATTCGVKLRTPSRNDATGKLTNPMGVTSSMLTYPSVLMTTRKIDDKGLPQLRAAPVVTDPIFVNIDGVANPVHVSGDSAYSLLWNTTTGLLMQPGFDAVWLDPFSMASNMQIGQRRRILVCFYNENALGSSFSDMSHRNNIGQIHGHPPFVSDEQYGDENGMNQIVYVGCVGPRADTYWALAMVAATGLPSYSDAYHADGDAFVGVIRAWVETLFGNAKGGNGTYAFPGRSISDPNWPVRAANEHFIDQATNTLVAIRSTAPSSLLSSSPAFVLTQQQLLRACQLRDAVNMGDYTVQAYGNPQYAGENYARLSEIYQFFANPPPGGEYTEIAAWRYAVAGLLQHKVTLRAPKQRSMVDVFQANATARQEDGPFMDRMGVVHNENLLEARPLQKLGVTWYDNRGPPELRVIPVSGLWGSVVMPPLPTPLWAVHANVPASGVMPLFVDPPSMDDIRTAPCQLAMFRITGGLLPTSAMVAKGTVGHSVGIAEYITDALRLQTTLTDSRIQAMELALQYMDTGNIYQDDPYGALYSSNALPSQQETAHIIMEKQAEAAAGYLVTASHAAKNQFSPWFRKPVSRDIDTERAAFMRGALNAI